MQNLKNRRSIEIYFILYLAAIIFLLPDGKTTPPDVDANQQGHIDFPFSLKPDKYNLRCKMTIDSSGPKIVYIDSVNTINCIGDVSNVEYEFFVEDESVKGSYRLSSDIKSTSKYFRIIEDAQNNAAKFIWSPSLEIKSNKTYRIKVKANVKPLNKSLATNLDNDFSEPAIILETDFFLNIIFDDASSRVQPADIAIANNGDSGFSANPIFQTQPIVMLGDFSFGFNDDDINAYASESWQNALIANNINLLKDLKGRPLIETSLDVARSGGTCKIHDIKANSIILTGRTPAAGKMTVKVTLIRRSDNTEKTEYFTVRPLIIDPPVFSQNMYPGVEYWIDPKLSNETRNPRAVLKDGVKILYQNSGRKFPFKPEMTDRNKILILERYIDGKLIEEFNRIKILDYENPIIKEFNPDGKGKVLVVVHSHGIVEGRRNEIDEFDISGNAKYRDLRGNRRSIGELTTMQIFEFTPKNPGRPFSFKIRAVDKLGKKSKLSSYAE